MRSAHLGLALLLLMTACGGDDDDSGGSQIDAAAGTGIDAAIGSADAAMPDAATNDGGMEADASLKDFPFQLIVPSCVPPGEPTLQVLLGAEPIGGQACTVEATLEAVRFEISRLEIIAPVTFVIGPDAEVSGAHCPGGTAACQEAEAGSITFDTYEPEVGASGSWELTVQGAELSGRFDARWCERACPPPKSQSAPRSR